MKYTAVSYIYVHSTAMATAPLLSAPKQALCTEGCLLLHDENVSKSKQMNRPLTSGKAEPTRLSRAWWKIIVIG